MAAKSVRFRNSKSEVTEHTNAVVPLISEDKKLQKLFFIGTAFYISKSGILMTAKHNLFDKKEHHFENLGVVHFLPENQYIIRPIRKITYSNDYDLAYLLPETILNKDKEVVSNDSLILTDSKPEMDEQLATYGYPNSKMDEFAAHFNSEFFLGNCRVYHPDGFSLLKNPCYQTTIQIKSGASGGPVFDKAGKVFAVCSTGYDLADGGEDISFVTPVLPSFNLMLEDGTDNRMTIFDLISIGIIPFEKVNYG